jgi:gas vesicle protein
MSDDVKWIQGFLLGTLLGVTSGALLGVLYAPAKGTRTRRRLARKAGDFGERASEALGVAGDLVERGRKRVGV